MAPQKKLYIFLLFLIVLPKTYQATTRVKAPCTTPKIHKENSGCSGDYVGRDITADGNFQACISSNIRKGFMFVVWFNGYWCYGGNCEGTFSKLDGTTIYDITSCTDGVYWVADQNADCPADQVVATKSKCMVAAAAVGLIFDGTIIEDLGAPAGCYKTTSSALFNKITDPESTTFDFSGRAGICFTVVEDCTNDAGFKCKFPFEYKGQNFYKCTKAGGYTTAWCYDVRGNNNWDYCYPKHWDHCY